MCVNQPSKEETTMASVHDVAKYILRKQGRMTAMKLQKLVYYAQAWSLVWDEKPLFSEEIQAWANGPVVPALYAIHKGQFEVTSWSEGDEKNLTEVERETIDSVLEYYGSRSSQWLSDLTHAEAPWKSARGSLPDGQRGSSVISHVSMSEYYLNLPSP